jgi:hypothetical protein
MEESILYAQDYSFTPLWAPAIDSSDNSDQDETENTAYSSNEGVVDPTLDQSTQLTV